MSVGEIRATLTEAIRTAEQAVISLGDVRNDVDAAVAEVERITKSGRHSGQREALARWHEASVEAGRAVANIRDGIDRAQTYLASLG